MAVDVCFYFQVHQPWRLRHYRFLDVGRDHHYFDDEKNAQILRKVADKCYLPMNNLLHDLIQEHEGRFKVSFAITGTLIQQCEKYAPHVIASFKRLVDTGCAELVSETSHHSLSALYDEEEFREQVQLHRSIMERHLGTPSKVFRDTELITSNHIAWLVGQMGFDGILAEGADHILRWRSPLFAYSYNGAPDVVALLKNYRLSDDIAFRFSDRGWPSWPLTAEKYAEWVKQIEVENPVSAKGGVPLLNLFMDYETFGEHQWASTGIFDFMKVMPRMLMERADARFITPSEAVARHRDEERPVIDAPSPYSWADAERDLSAWRGNPIQDSALRSVYRLGPAVKRRAKELGGEEGAQLLETWRRLLTSDHFYYMCTKYFADGDVHKYFSPYESPYDAHIIFMNVLADFERRIGYREAASA